MNDENYMEYEGQRFKTIRAYSDWEDFKSDRPNNFAVDETERMREAVLAVRFAETAVDRESVMQQMLGKQFPGFGCGQLGVSRDQIDFVAAFLVEIPRSETHRVLGYARIDADFVLVSDFVAPQTPMPARVVLTDDTIEFYGLDKTLIRSDPLPVEE